VAKTATARAYVHPVRLDLVEEALDEGDFLWRRWNRAMVAADHDLAAVVRFAEERLLGCIDGLRVGGDAVIEPVLAPALDGEPARRSTTALALAGGGDAAWECLAAALRAAPPEALPALARGIELEAALDVVAELERRLDLGDAADALKAAFLDICAFRRRAPAAPLTSLVSGSAAPAPLRAALVLARFVPVADGESLIRGALHAPGPVGAAAVESGLVLGLPGAAGAGREALRVPGRGAVPARLRAGRRRRPRAGQAVRPARRRRAG